MSAIGAMAQIIGPDDWHLASRSAVFCFQCWYLVFFNSLWMFSAFFWEWYAVWLFMPLLFMLHIHWVWWVLTWRGIRSAFIVEKDSLHWYVMTLQSLRHVYMWCAQMFVHVWGECWSVDIYAVYVCLSICSSTQLGPLNLLSSTSRHISCIGVSESCCHT